MEQAKGTVQWDGKRVEIEGPPPFVAAELEKFRNAALGAQQHVPAAQENPERRTTSEAEFVKLKQPADHFEKIAVLAFRMSEQGKLEFDGDEMRRSYLRAGIKPPKVMSQALIDTKNKRDYIEPTSTRGTYRLTTHGADFVGFDLPRSEAK